MSVFMGLTIVLDFMVEPKDELLFENWRLIKSMEAKAQVHQDIYAKIGYRRSLELADDYRKVVEALWCRRQEIKVKLLV